ncbi:unnamed protein product [Pleuronectes platessa]|uniref:Uncharacterized protein n=1 Tax=Pleuronectes platessa TaxID=8262 RepID=A0A9N7UD88_PLEPL|nr:unnamed protein product [Pleuronectes platessa]
MFLQSPSAPLHPSRGVRITAHNYGVIPFNPLCPPHLHDASTLVCCTSPAGLLVHSIRRRSNVVRMLLDLLFDSPYGGKVIFGRKTGLRAWIHLGRLQLSHTVQRRRNRPRRKGRGLVSNTPGGECGGQCGCTVTVVRVCYACAAGPPG